VTTQHAGTAPGRLRHVLCGGSGRRAGGEKPEGAAAGGSEGRSCTAGAGAGGCSRRLPLPRWWRWAALTERCRSGRIGCEPLLHHIYGRGMRPRLPFAALGVTGRPALPGGASRCGCGGAQYRTDISSPRATRIMQLNRLQTPADDLGGEARNGCGNILRPTARWRQPASATFTRGRWTHECGPDVRCV